MSSEQAPDFEGAIRELEEIVRTLDRDDVELDEAMALFEKGVGHLRSATRLLDEARTRVEELIESASGDLLLVDFEESADEGSEESKGSKGISEEGSEEAYGDGG